MARQRASDAYVAAPPGTAFPASAASVIGRCHSGEPASEELDAVLAEVRRCRLCAEAPIGRPLPHSPRPVVRAEATARLAIVGQAPGTRVHQSGMPFLDASGDRLRQWMAVTPEEFYDASRVAVVPMGFCFPGLDAHGSDLPPRRECAPAWRERVLAALPRIEVLLLIGGYAQRWHLSAPHGTSAGLRHRAGVTATVTEWRAILARSKGGIATGPAMFPLPHPSWRNNAWIKRNPWFEADLLPVLRREVRRVLE